MGVLLLLPWCCEWQLTARLGPLQNVSLFERCRVLVDIMQFCFFCCYQFASYWGIVFLTCCLNEWRSVGCLCPSDVESTLEVAWCYRVSFFCMYRDAAPHLLPGVPKPFVNLQVPHTALLAHLLQQALALLSLWGLGPLWYHKSRQVYGFRSRHFTVRNLSIWFRRSGLFPSFSNGFCRLLQWSTMSYNGGGGSGGGRPR